MLSIALPKGRLGEKAYAIFESIGYDCEGVLEDSRKLIFEDERKGLRYFWAKPSDVAVYVEHGAADIGIVGKDILLENSPDVYELLDLGIGKCRMAVAGNTDRKALTRGRSLVVATKFPNIAKEYFDRYSREIEIIGLHGSIEIAPLLKLSDVIVDLVETGKTLAENGLVLYETVTNISARLIANKASFKFKSDIINSITHDISAILATDEGD